jgi:glycosyltransferase involved in cell wall biosynthesis
MKILYLYSEVMGYTMATVKELAKRGNEVHIVHWDHKKLTPYRPPIADNVFMYKRSEYSTHQIKRLVKSLTPSLIVLSGWMDKGYMSVAKECRSRGTPVVAAIDDQWYGTIRQRIAALVATTGYFSRFYSHAWVAGPYQFEYVRRLGFEKKNILFDLYSADLDLFNQVYLTSIAKKKIHYPHRFLFVGRFEPTKGLDILLKAWHEMGEKRGGWELHLIGNGTLRTLFKDAVDVVIRDFMQPELLAEELANVGCVVIPSKCEPWGVVTHEFTAAGIPLVISDIVGAAPTFLISGLNGYAFNVNDYKALATQMCKITSMSDRELIAMSFNSKMLSTRITPMSSASNLLSAFH